MPASGNHRRRTRARPARRSLTRLGNLAPNECLGDDGIVRRQTAALSECHASDGQVALLLSYEAIVGYFDHRIDAEQSRDAVAADVANRSRPSAPAHERLPPKPIVGPTPSSLPSSSGTPVVAVR
jgi:hypothetical protein